jgi:hypothetical protein
MKRGFTIFLATVSLSGAIASDSDSHPHVIEQAYMRECEGGETGGPYRVIDDGIKLRFDQIDKQYLGKRCSVFLKPGVIGNGVGTGIEPEGMFVMRGNVQIENGELFALGRRAINITWFWPNDGGGHGGDEPEKNIDYVMIEK